MTRAILSHADYTGVPRESRLEKTLFACDEMAGFVTAAALVRPSKSVLDLEAVVGHQADEGQGVRPRRAAATICGKGAEEIGLPLDEHITNVIAFMREQADALGLARERCDASSARHCESTASEHCARIAHSTSTATSC